MSATVYNATICVVALFATAFRIGVYYNQQKTTENKNILDILPIVLYGIAGFWGLIVIMNGVIV